MTTRHLGIIVAIVALLKDAGVADGRVYRARTRAISQEQPHGVVVRLSNSMSHLSEIWGGPTNWDTLINIECYGREIGGAPDQAADEVLQAAFEALAQSPDLGGLVSDIAPLEGDTLSWDYDELDTGMACITAKFVAKHQTTGRTLT